MSFSALMFWRAEWNDLTSRERARRNPAKERGMCECVDCGYCCCCRTCTPLPSEIPIIAENLGVSVDELVSTKMVGDYEEGRPPFLRWINTKQEHLAGEMLSASETFSVAPCIWRDEAASKCKIQQVKPIDAKESECWSSKTGKGHKSWKSGDLEKIAPEMDLYAEDDWE